MDVNIHYDKQVHQYLHRTCDCSLFILCGFQGGIEATTTLIYEKGNMESMLTSERQGVPWALSMSANSQVDMMSL